MARKTIYIPDDIDRKIEGHVSVKRQAGANAQEASYSSVAGELLRLGLMVYESQSEEKEVFDLQGYRQTLLSETVKARSHAELITLMVSEMNQALVHKNVDPDVLTKLANQFNERTDDEIDMVVGQFFTTNQVNEG